jgi:hypothetical protein
MFVVVGCYHRSGQMARRFLYVIACVAPVWAVITYATDGVTLHLGGLRLKATEPVRPLIVGVFAAAIYVWRYSREAYDTDGVWLMAFLRRAAVVAAPVIILLGCAIGIYSGSFTAGGSDAYGYVSQAGLWLKGSLRIEQPWVQQFSWPEREVTFAPLGYRPISPNGTIVPTYASGLPILMAVFQGLLGANGPVLRRPRAGDAGVVVYLFTWQGSEWQPAGWCARSVALTHVAGFSRTLLLPMSDVPVAAGWTLVALLALKKTRDPPAGRRSRCRRNFDDSSKSPVARPGACDHWLVAWRDRRAEIMATRDLRSDVLRFGIGLAPGIVAIAALNNYLYGSPLTSGYGALGDIYSWSSAWPNLKRYSLWLMQTQTPLVGAGDYSFRSPQRLSVSYESKCTALPRVRCSAYALLLHLLQSVRNMDVSPISAASVSRNVCADGDGGPFHLRQTSDCVAAGGGDGDLHHLPGVDVHIHARPIHF